MHAALNMRLKNNVKGGRKQIYRLRCFIQGLEKKTKITSAVFNRIERSMNEAYFQFPTEKQKNLMNSGSKILCCCFAGHNANQDEPEVVNKLIIDFLYV